MPLCINGSETDDVVVPREERKCDGRHVADRDYVSPVTIVAFHGNDSVSPKSKVGKGVVTTTWF